MIKLPEPEVIGVEEIDYGTFEVRKGYTESQMRQAIRDALEEAAQACTNIAISPSNVILGVAIECRDAIRKLSEELK